MNYTRVIPRDLFNEANLLKCYGRLWILLDEMVGHHEAQLGDKNNEHYGAAFNIVQDETDGSISIWNLCFYVHGKNYRLFRPLNARSPWPLWCTSPDGEFCERVFSDAGFLSSEFLRLIKGEAP